MWPTTNGLRCLSGDELELVRRAVGMMVDYLVAEGREGDEQREYGIQWFDQWDWQQRLWLLERATLGLLTDISPPTPAAMWEATIDSIFAEVIFQVATEIENANFIQQPNSWRQCVVKAYCSQQSRSPNIDIDHQDATSWHRIITQLADAILGVRLYLKAESFRDQSIEKTQEFLQQRGLPTDFLQQIPPLRTATQTQTTIDQIQSIVLQ